MRLPCKLLCKYLHLDHKITKELIQMVSNVPPPQSFSSSFWGAYHYSDISLGKVKYFVSAVPSQRKVVLWRYLNLLQLEFKLL